MAVKVQWDTDGPFAICDTVAEAAELLKQARSLSNGTPKEKSEVPMIKSGEDRIDVFFANMNHKGKLLLKTLLNYPSGVEGEEFSKAVGIDSSGFGGVMGSLSKAAKKGRLTLDQFVKSEAKFEGARRYRWLAPGRLLVEHKNRVQ
jgi:hypothetical protein